MGKLRNIHDPLDFGPIFRETLQRSANHIVAHIPDRETWRPLAFGHSRSQVKRRAKSLGWPLIISWIISWIIQWIIRNTVEGRWRKQVQGEDITVIDSLQLTSLWKQPLATFASLPRCSMLRSKSVTELLGRAPTAPTMAQVEGQLVLLKKPMLPTRRLVTTFGHILNMFAWWRFLACPSAAVLLWK